MRTSFILRTHIKSQVWPGRRLRQTDLYDFRASLIYKARPHPQLPNKVIPGKLNTFRNIWVAQMALMGLRKRKRTHR